MSLIKNTSALLLSTSVAVPIAFVTGVIVTRSLSVDERGVYSLANATIGIVAMIAQLGLPGALIMRMRNARTPTAEVLGMGVVILMFSSALVGLVCIGFGPYLREQFLAGAPEAIMLLIVFAVPIHLIGQLLGAVARGLDRFVWVSSFQILINILGFVTVGVTILLGHVSTIPIIVAFLVARVAMTIWIGIKVVQAAGFSLRLHVAEIKRTASIGLQNYASALAGRLHERVDVLMIAYFLQDASEVAIYAIAAGLVAQLALLPNSIGLAFFPQLASLQGKAAEELLCRVVRHAALWVVILAAALCAIAPFMLPMVFGEAYAASVPAFLILAPGMVMLTIYRLTGRYFVVIDRMQVNIYTQIGSVLVNLALNVILIPRFGILGAATASLLSYCFESIWLIAIFLRITNRSILDLVVFRRGDAEVYERILAPLLRRLRSAD